MFRRFSVNFAVLSMFMDAGLIAVALITAVTIRPALRQLPFLVPVQEIRLPIYLYLFVPVLWVGSFMLVSVYDPKRITRLADELQNITVAVALATLVTSGLLYLFYRDFSRWLLVLFVLISWLLLAGWRAMARLVSSFVRWPAAERRVLIVGAGPVGRRMRDMVEDHAWTGLKFVGYLDDKAVPDDRRAILGKLKKVRQVVQQQQIDDVIIALPQRANGRINELIVDLHELPVRVRVIPDYFALALYRATVEDFGGVPMISLRDPALNEVQRLVKRAFDLALTSAAFLLLSPIMTLVAIAIKLDSAGPALFRQKRVGENGSLFTMFKFRTMIDGADDLRDQVTEITEDGKVLFKRADDPRTTRVGRWLRRASLDELPQLLNVLRGDMSLVGPRPELPWLVDRYESWQRKRFAVPQGITGWWQVNGRSTKPMHLHTEDDLYYIQNYSLWLDIYILLRTVFVVLRGAGAY